MTKKENLEDPNSCWNKAADDEPIFISRGHDHFAPVVVRFWCHLMNEHYKIGTIPGNGYPDGPTPLYPPTAIIALQKVNAAYDVAYQMELWPNRKVPD